MPDNVIEEALRRARHDLLDISTRNRLISTPRGRARSTSIEILDELVEQVFARLVGESKSMSFLPIRDEEEEEDANEAAIAEASLALAQPDDDLVNGAPNRHSDNKLQTRLVSKTLQSRLLRLFYDARTYEEEQGVNILFLATGFLKWFESEASTQERYAPLLLVPVRLERQTAGEKFKIEALDEDITTNLSLQAKLKQEFNVDLPDVPELDDLVPGNYFELVRAAIAGQRRWEVCENDMVLWFFSFGKFLMYRDLDPKTWPDGATVSDKENVQAVVDGSFRQEPPVFDDDDKLDDVLDPANLLHVVDADSSQSVVIEEARRGRHLVVQGPPGTGKSQTITNIIAAAVKDGKKVLFVAEKMAALEVVKSRMDRVGLGVICLELHSHKANKKAVLADIGQTLECKRPRMATLNEEVNELRRLRDQLNQHVSAIHLPLLPAQVTAYQVIGELVRLQAKQVSPARFSLENPLAWSKENFKSRLSLVQDLAGHLQRVGIPTVHPWRGVGLPVVLPADLERLKEQFNSLVSRLDALMAAGDALADVLGLPHPSSPRELSALAVLANQLVKAPSLDSTAITSDAWARQKPEIDALLNLGVSLQQSRAELAAKLGPSAWQTDVSPARKQIMLRGTSWFRWLSKPYRQAVAVLEEVCIERPPVAQADRLSLLDRLMAAQQAERDFKDGEALGKSAFGTLWQGEGSDWDQLKAVADWVRTAEQANVPPSFRDVLARLTDKKPCLKLLQEIAGDFKRCISDVQSVFQNLQLDMQEAFAAKDLNTIPLGVLRDRFAQWLEQPEAIHVWSAYRLRLQRLPAAGLAELAKLLHAGDVLPAAAIDQLSIAYYECLMRECYRQHPALAEFTGESHESVRTRFRQLDELRMELARKEVALAHYQSIPKSDELGDMAKIRNELQKRRRHWPIRKLLAEAGHAIQAIKPVFMMSPTSIAQFLAPGALEFDLLLIDEASQVRPVEALGAMARCKQVVVVGDEKQMPPTSFFTTVVENLDENEEVMNAADVESILGLCLARNIKPRMLSWHYRSRHHSLIAVSNYEFYDNKLYVIPNPEHEMDGFGLRFHYLKHGEFDRGGSATNRVEARRVAEAVMEHARQHPQKSLGVGAFSIRQRDAILDELEILRRQNPALETFFGNSGEEPFFVKNLENLQGDERDVIFISVGYGPDKTGFVTMTFGPLSMEGGERRLNVLISRARERCEVFSSLKADDIDLNRAQARGAASLKRFLKYAETGWLDAETASDGEPGSGFEEEVAKAIRSSGYEVEAQVGVAGFFIDLAVKDPHKPGRFLLGIECDGATYHSARWARDRDRLRQDVLESRGWTIHRIWSTDWFRQPKEQLRRLLAAIELAKTPISIDPVTEAADEQEETGDREADPGQVEEADGDEWDDSSESTERSAVPYEEARLNKRVNASRPLHEAPINGLADVAYNVVLVEGPIHREEIARRIAAFWGAMRTTKKMVAAVDSALHHAQRMGKVIADGEFYSVAGQEVLVRSRATIASATLRQPEMIPPAEISAALLQVVTTHLGVTVDETVVAACRLLGFRSTGPQLKKVVCGELDALIGQGKFRVHHNKLFDAIRSETAT